MRYWPICGECGEPITRDDVGVLVAFRTASGDALVTGRVPMHLDCTLDLAESTGASLSEG